MMRRQYLLQLLLLFVILTPFAMMTGCEPQPELPKSSYGKVVDQLPDLPEAKEKYKFPEDVELKYIH